MFLTNNLDLSALTIAELYRCRWQIELCFKWIKQRLRIKSFFGTSENAVKSQIWITVSVYILVAIAKKRLHLSASFYEILQILSLTMFERISLGPVRTNRWLRYAYGMEITEEQYCLIEDCLSRQCGNASLTNLQVLNAILFVTEQSCKWRGLPKRFGRWHTVYTRWSRWSKAGGLIVFLKDCSMLSCPGQNRCSLFG